MRHEAMVKVTNGVAVGGLTMPAWWPTLAEVSTFAAALVPIFSLIWLLIQIVRALRPKPIPRPVHPAAPSASASTSGD